MAYNYDRTAASQSYLLRVLAGQADQLARDLETKLNKYTEGRSKAKVEASSGYLNVTVWLKMTENEEPSYGKPVHDPQIAREAKEVAELMLGQRVAIAPHSVASNVWVATVKLDLR